MKNANFGKRLKRVGISLVTTAALMMGMVAGIPMHAKATTENYDLAIGGYYFSSDHLVFDSHFFNGFTGVATYDPDNNVLTLNNFNNGVRVSYDSRDCCVIRYSDTEDLTIRIIGNNRIEISNDAVPAGGNSEDESLLGGKQNRFGILSTKGADITIIGSSLEDTLIVNSGNNTVTTYENNPVICETVAIKMGGNLTVKDCSLYAIGGDSKGNSYGIHMERYSDTSYYHGSLTVDHAYVRAGAGNIVGDYAGSKNIGIYCLYDRDADTRMTVQNGSYVSAYALLNNNGTSNDFKEAIRPEEGLYISNSKVEAASQSGYAIALKSVRNNASGKGWTNFAGTEGETAIPVSGFDGPGQIMPLCKKIIIGQKNTVTVNNGSCSGTGSFEVQEEVAVTANAPSAGYVFAGWTGTEGVTFANANSSTTTFYMPGTAVTVTANYRELDRAVVTQIPTAKTGLVANDSALELINAGSASGGTLKYALGNANEATGAWDTLIPKGTNAGTYYVWYKAVGNDTHRDSIPAYVTVSIAEKSSSGGNGGGNSNSGGSNEGGNSEENTENGGTNGGNSEVNNENGGNSNNGGSNEGGNSEENTVNGGTNGGNSEVNNENGGNSNNGGTNGGGNSEENTVNGGTNGGNSEVNNENGGNSNNGGSNEGGNSEESSENGGSSTNNEATDNNSTEESKNNSGSDNNSSNEIKDEREVKFGDDPFYRALDSDRKFLVPIDYVDRSGSPMEIKGKDLDWNSLDGKSYWYENGIKQGTYFDNHAVLGDGTVRGREIFDPTSDGWYWLDTIYDGAKAIGKEVWMPYIYQDEDEWNEETIRQIANESDAGMEELVYKYIKEKAGKWVRYDENGRMLKGWVTIEGTLADLYPDQKGNKYYYDSRTGLMAKGDVTIDGVKHYFNEITGVLEN